MSDARELPVSFSSFVVSLAASAMLHLGETADPSTGKKEVNLPVAKQTVDLMAVLKEKTAGNLDEEEQQLLDTLLGDLQGKVAKAS